MEGKENIKINIKFNLNRILLREMVMRIWGENVVKITKYLGNRLLIIYSISNILIKNIN